MPATARLIVMMEGEEKAALEAQAEAASISTAEFVRRRLFGRGVPEERAFLDMLAALEPLVRKACGTIDSNLAEIRSLRRSADARDGQVAARARSELKASELTAVAQRMASSRAPRSARRRAPRP